MKTNKPQNNTPTKPSGIDWIGDIPSGWISRRGKFVFRSGKKINRGMKCENVLSLTMKGVIARSELGDGGLLPNDYSTFQIFEKDDLVFKLIDLENYKTSRVGLVYEQGIMSSAYLRIFPKIGQDVSVRYFYYFFYNLYLEGIYNFLGMGVRSTMNDADLLEMGIIIPPKETQEKIVAFLDEKTAVVDETIAKKKRLIALLKEKRSSIITRAVTRGLDPDAPTKPSGIDWIGDIPSGWSSDSLRHLLIKNDSGIWGADDIFGDGFFILRSTEIQENGEWRLDDPITRVIGESEFREKRLISGDLLLTKSSGSQEHLGKVALVNKDVEEKGCAYSNFMQRLRFSENTIPRFAFYVLNSRMVKEQIMYWGTTTSGLINLNNTLINNFVIPLPPKETQEKIVAFLDEKTKRIDETIATIERQIERLTEYRASLIYHCVTGKTSV